MFWGVLVELAKARVGKKSLRNHQQGQVKEYQCTGVERAQPTFGNKKVSVFHPQIIEVLPVFILLIVRQYLLKIILTKTVETTASCLRNYAQTGP